MFKVWSVTSSTPLLQQCPACNHNQMLLPQQLPFFFYTAPCVHLLVCCWIGYPGTSIPPHGDSVLIRKKRKKRTNLNKQSARISGMLAFYGKYWLCSKKNKSFLLLFVFIDDYWKPPTQTDYDTACYFHCMPQIVRMETGKVGKTRSVGLKPAEIQQICNWTQLSTSATTGWKQQVSSAAAIWVYTGLAADRVQNDSVQNKSGLWWLINLLSR